MQARVALVGEARHALGRENRPDERPAPVLARVLHSFALFGSDMLGQMPKTHAVEHREKSDDRQEQDDENCSLICRHASSLQLYPAQSVIRLHSLSKVIALAGRKTRRDLRGKIGAGEEIRTLDPNLGKVVLYH